MKPNPIQEKYDVEEFKWERDGNSLILKQTVHMESRFHLRDAESLLQQWEEDIESNKQRNSEEAIKQAEEYIEETQSKVEELQKAIEPLRKDLMAKQALAQKKAQRAKKKSKKKEQ